MLQNARLLFIGGDMIAFFLIIGVCFVGLLGLLGWMVWNRITLKRRAEILDEMPPESDKTEIIPAIIVKKESNIQYNGSARYPKHFVDFSVTFLTEDNRYITKSVPEDIYPFLRELSSGELVLYNERFVDFVAEPSSKKEDDPQHITYV